MLETNKTPRASGWDFLINLINLPLSSFKLFFLFSLLVLLTILSSDFIRAHRDYSELNRDNLRAVNLFNQLSRKHITKGTYHLTITDVYYNFLRSLVYRDLKLRLVSLETNWNNSNSYRDYEHNLSALLNPIAPLVTYLYPQDQYQKDILDSYDALTTNNYYTYNVGYVEGDVSPKIGSIDFSVSGGFALDALNRSVGVDLGEIGRIVALRLNTYTDKYRIRAANLSIWLSNDNENFYQYQGNLKFFLDAKSILIDQLDINSRYLKVNCNFKDANYTFADDVKSILKVYGPPIFFE